MNITFLVDASLRFILLFKLYVCMWVCGHECWCLQRPEHWIPRAGILGGCEPPVWVLGIKLEHSVRAVSTLNTWTISPTPWVFEVVFNQAFQACFNLLIVLSTIGIYSSFSLGMLEPCTPVFRLTAILFTVIIPPTASAVGQSRGFIYARQVLSHWAISPTPKLIFLNLFY